MIITLKELRGIVEMNRLNANNRVYFLEDPEKLYSFPNRLHEPIKKHEMEDAKYTADTFGLKRDDWEIPIRTVTYSLWGYDTDICAFVFKKDEKK